MCDRNTLLSILTVLCVVSIVEAFYLFVQNWDYFFDIPNDINTLNIWRLILHGIMSVGSLAGLLVPIFVWIELDTPSINYTTIPRKDGKNCGNCVEGDEGYCCYAGEIGNHYCDKWSEGRV